VARLRSAPAAPHRGQPGDRGAARAVPREGREDELDEALDYPSATDARGPERTLDLERAIAVLPSRARTVFVLHDVEGWAHGEIAAAVGIAAGTSKAQLHRARRLLQRVVTP
jgi:RNA polymerase sigma factor (sigma-70 family)